MQNKFLHVKAAINLTIEIPWRATGPKGDRAEVLAWERRHTPHDLVERGTGRTGGMEGAARLLEGRCRVGLPEERAFSAGAPEENVRELQKPESSPCPPERRARLRAAPLLLEEAVEIERAAGCSSGWELD